jgi:hypothetical protein
LYFIRQKKNRRIKSALKLYELKNEVVERFDKKELLAILQDSGYHSVEISDSEDESRPKLVNGKNFVHVYDHPWRSDAVNIFIQY